MSKKLQQCVVVNLENNFSISAKFTVIVNNNYPRISGKMGFTIEEKAFLLECYFRNVVNRQSKKRPCIVSITLHMTKYEKRFNKTKEEVTLLIYFLFNHPVL
jgi:hypothetical protein